MPRPHPNTVREAFPRRPSLAHSPATKSSPEEALQSRAFQVAWAEARKLQQLPDESEREFVARKEQVLDHRMEAYLDERRAAGVEREAWAIKLQATQEGWRRLTKVHEATQELLKAHRVTVPVVDSDGEVVQRVTVTADHPHAQARVPARSVGLR